MEYDFGLPDGPDFSPATPPPGYTTLGDAILGYQSELLADAMGHARALDDDGTGSSLARHTTLLMFVMSRVAAEVSITNRLLIEALDPEG